MFFVKKNVILVFNPVAMSTCFLCLNRCFFTVIFGMIHYEMLEYLQMWSEKMCWIPYRIRSDHTRWIL